MYSVTLQDYFSSIPGHVWNILIDEQNADLIIRLMNNYPKLGDVSTINRGLITGNRKKYFSGRKISDDYVPINSGADVNRYVAKQPSEFVLFQKPKGSGGSWDPEMHLADHKIVVRQIGVKPMASILREPIAITGNLFSVRFSSVEEELYSLGIINSKLIDFFWKTMFSDFKTSFPQVTIFSLSQIPIHPINFSDPAEKAQHDKMVALVESMLELHKRLGICEDTTGERDARAADRVHGWGDRSVGVWVVWVVGRRNQDCGGDELSASHLPDRINPLNGIWLQPESLPSKQVRRTFWSAKTPQEKEMLSRQIESTDGAIDRLVYGLSPSGMIYGLTEEEIKIVEGKE